MADQELQVTHVNVRQSISILFFRIIVVEILFAMALMIQCTIFPCSTIQQGWQEMLTIGSFVRLLLLLTKIVLTMTIFFQWIKEYYEIWPNRITHQMGILFQKHHEWGFEHIAEIKLEQSFLGRILNYGTIELYDKDLRHIHSVYLIHNPGRYFGLLKRLLPQADEKIHTVGEKFSDESY